MRAQEFVQRTGNIMGFHGRATGALDVEASTYQRNEFERECTETIRLLRDNRTDCLRRVAAIKEELAEALAVPSIDTATLHEERRLLEEHMKALDWHLKDVVGAKSDLRRRRGRSSLSPRSAQHVPEAPPILDAVARKDDVVGARLRALDDLRAAGTLTLAEYEAARGRVLGASSN